MKYPTTVQPIDSGLPPWIGSAIQTRQAQALVGGRPKQGSGKPEIHGLEAFARAAAKIHIAAAADDPYAAFALLQIEAALATAHAAVRAEIPLMTGIINRTQDGEAAMPKPAPRAARAPRMPPPANPYAHLGACLLADFDRLVQAILAARQCEAIDRGRAYALLFEAGRPVRHAFSRPFAVWRHTGVTRRDIHNNTPLARRAKALHAKLKIPAIPAAVLRGIERAEHAPAARIRRAAQPGPRHSVRPHWRGQPERPTEVRP
jgi:integrating conjugative element protein (TIGR03761 family)